MALVVGILLAVFVFEDRALQFAAVLVGGSIEIGEAWFWYRWTHRRPAAVGVEALVGRTAVVADDGWVRLNGELWRARGVEGAQPGDRVVVERIDGLTLLVRRRA
jgi:membrane protein implicated in regulation of membrane protease activity